MVSPRRIPAPDSPAGIIRAFRAGETPAAIARRLGVSSLTIYRVLRENISIQRETEAAS